MVGARGKGSKEATRTKGARYDATRLIESAMEKEVQAIVKKAIESAKAGDMAAVRLVFDRIAPAARERTIQFDMPRIEGAADLPAAVLSIVSAVADGDVAPGEALQLVGLLEQYRKQVETADLAARIAALEEANAKQP